MRSLSLLALASAAAVSLTAVALADEKPLVKAYQIEGGRPVPLDPDRVVVEVDLGKRESLRELLSKLDRVRRYHVEVTVRDAETKKPITRGYSVEVKGSTISSPPCYNTDFPRDFAIVSHGPSGFRLSWVGVTNEVTVPVGAKGYESKQVTLKAGEQDVFLEKKASP